MARGRKPRTWIKMDCEGILRGSINYLLPLEGQAVWMKMIALSEVCGGRPGWIEDNNQNGLPDNYIAHELHCTVDLLKNVLKKMGDDGAIKINGTGAIQLVNFDHYQFREYDRQLPYRQAKKQREQSSYGQFNNVHLSNDEKAKLIEKFGNEGFKDRVEKLSLYIESKGDKYKSHYATILNWERMESQPSKNAGINRINSDDPEKYVKGKYGHMVRR